MTELAKRYGGSLYDLAAEEHLERQLLEEMKTVVDCFQAEPSYYRLLSVPNLPKAERRKLIEEAFASSVHLYLVNFLKLLCDEGDLRELCGCYDAYRKCFNKANGILEAAATSAVELSDTQKQRLIGKLETITGKKIELTVKVQPDLLGGIKIDLDGKQLDGTIRTRLDKLRSDISGVII